jgi:1-deoxy-D-xylulose-5-phosphate reductoisomerase
MRLPILYALTWPERIASDLTFDMASLAQLDFQQPDFARFPCLRLAYEAAAASQNHCIALNAADEVAVEAFLHGQLPFLGIPRTIERVLALTAAGSPASISEVLIADLAARELAREQLAVPC